MNKPHLERLLHFLKEDLKVHEERKADTSALLEAFEGDVLLWFKRETVGLNRNFFPGSPYGSAVSSTILHEQREMSKIKDPDQLKDYAVKAVKKISVLAALGKIPHIDSRLMFINQSSTSCPDCDKWRNKEFSIKTIPQELIGHSHGMLVHILGS